MNKAVCTMPLTVGQGLKSRLPENVNGNNYPKISHRREVSHGYWTGKNGRT